jgi:hypothetical protein
VLGVIRWSAGFRWSRWEASVQGGSGLFAIALLLLDKSAFDTTQVLECGIDELFLLR